MPSVILAMIQISSFLQVVESLYEFYLEEDEMIDVVIIDAIRTQIALAKIRFLF